MAIYEKPTKVLMNEFSKAELTPGQEFGKKQVVQWFAKHYPKIRPTTVQMHVEGMCVNSTLRKHHKSIYAGSGHDLFWKVGPGRFRLWDPQHDPKPVYGDEKPEQITEELDQQEIHDAADEFIEPSSSEFAAERDLRNYLEKNLGTLEAGLRLYEEEGLSGIEFPAGGRRVDILALGGDGGFVVIELKVSRGYDRVIGQIMRYMAWVKANLAEGKPVRGIIVARDISEDLRLAASLIEGVKLVEYELSFKLKPVT